MQLIKKYFPKITESQVALLEKFKEILTENNANINVVSRKDIENLEERHILHSLAIAKYLNFKAGSNIVDVGTGGGLPGIPLAIMFPHTNFTLIDSRKKKIEATIAIAEKLNLPNISVKQIRSTELKEHFDFVIGRAVTSFPEFYGAVNHLVGKKEKNALPNGILYLKGGDFKKEVANFKYVEIIDIKEMFSEEFFETKKIIYLPF